MPASRSIWLMLKNLKREWQSLGRGRVGHRFQDQYDANRDSKKKLSWVGRLVRIGVAVVCVAIGVVLVFIPGPAILFFAIAGGLLAAESRWLARILDAMEVGLRKLFHWAVVHWKRLHAFGKVVVASIATLGAGAAAYASYYLLAA